ncbi:hypothetical protein [Caviibacterium pharyngocola]|nr:hypothetical protein [Caviibacterium pharyngocola]
MPGSLGRLNIQLTLEQVKFQQALEQLGQQIQRFSHQFQVNFDSAR